MEIISRDAHACFHLSEKIRCKCCYSNSPHYTTIFTVKGEHIPSFISAKEVVNDLNMRGAVLIKNHGVVAVSEFFEEAHHVSY